MFSIRFGIIITEIIDNLLDPDGIHRRQLSHVQETPDIGIRGLIHIGLDHFPAGRMGDPPSTRLSEQLESLGFEIGRLKTGTTPRLNGRTIDYQSLEIQAGDKNPRPFSFSTKKIPLPQVPCHITYTNEKTHNFIKEGLHRSPLYSGIIKGVGARYCPSVEDKVVRFAEKERHQIFLEPEGLDTFEVYPNGLATSLPVDIQVKMVRSVHGLEKAEILRPGYAIEYDYINPLQLQPTQETKLVEAHTKIKKLQQQILAESAYLQDEIKLENNFGNIIGRSEALKYVLSRVEQVAPQESTVLIQGETGTGKELFARALHELSPRGKRPLVKVNCAALPSELIESEMFGRQRGAYTGATDSQIGRFELANG